MPQTNYLTRATIHLDHLTHNLKVLQELAGERPMWPAIKANAYGHGLVIIARHLVSLGYSTLCVAHVGEVLELQEEDVEARYLLLSATLPEHSKAIVKSGCEAAVCTREMVDALAREAQKQGKQIAVHVMVDTGMGRIGIYPEQVIGFLDYCQKYPALNVRGLMSHFPCADEADKTLSNEEIESFRKAIKATEGYGIREYHMANSAAIFDLPHAGFDAVRPGIAIYGLHPSQEIQNTVVNQLRPVLEWKTRITFLKEVPEGTGLSYGHTFHTSRPSLIATVPVGYGDGLQRNLSNRLDMLIHGERCPQVGRITMDQSLVDVTALRGRVALGDEVVLIGRQGDAEILADEMARTLGTINYEIVTAIARRVKRVVAD